MNNLTLIVGAVAMFALLRLYQTPPRYTSSAKLLLDLLWGMIATVLFFIGILRALGGN